METKLKRYCDVKSCVNAKGTKSRNFNFFRVSKDLEKKKRWIAAIQKHQSIDGNVKSLSVCSLHFTKNDFIREGVLNKNQPLPTIFETLPEVEPVAHDIDSVSLDGGNLSESYENDQEIAIVDENMNNLVPYTNKHSEKHISAPEMDTLAKNIPVIDGDMNNNSIAYLRQKNIDLQKIIFEKEQMLYRADNKILILERKLDEKIEKYQLLNREYKFYKKEYEKLKSDNDSIQNADVAQIINCLTGKSHLKYSKAVRQFALTIDFYSPKAYRYIREKFNRCLPHPTTLKKYYVNSGANGEPGISSESLSNLRLLVNDFEKAGKKFFCSLAFDEMFIRPHVQYNHTQKTFQGFITYGQEKDHELPVATNVIVFMINGMGMRISVPIAHQFIDTLSKEKKASLLKSVITAISETNAIIINITCDGLPTNLAMFKLLGASLNPDDMRPYIMNPVTGDRIYVMLDACHMLKLARNCLWSRGVLHDGKEQPIKWEHFERLERARTNQGLSFLKLNKQHVEFERNKMSVALAAQTLSRSVAEGMEFLMDAGKVGFRDCIGTIEFTRTVNDLFDIMNTGFEDKLEDCKNNKFKVPLSSSTADCVLPFLDQATEYIKSLKLHGVSILKSRLKTGFLGFLMDISVVKSVYAEYVETGKLEKLATYHASQDPLESFFGRIRSKCGNNTNPTVEQFKSAYRKILINNEIEASIRANCLDNLNIYFISSAQNPDANEAQIEGIHENIEEIEHFTPNDNLLDAYNEAAICKIASNIEGIIRNRANFECDLCLNILNENDKVSIEIFDNKQYEPCVATALLQSCKKILQHIQN